MPIPAKPLEDEQAKSTKFVKAKSCPFLLSHLRTSRHNFQNLLYCYNTSRQSSQEFSKAIHKEKSSKETIRKYQKSIKALTFTRRKFMIYMKIKVYGSLIGGNSFNGRGDLQSQAKRDQQLFKKQVLTPDLCPKFGPLSPFPALHPVGPLPGSCPSGLAQPCTPERTLPVYSCSARNIS